MVNVVIDTVSPRVTAVQAMVLSELYVMRS